MGTDQRKNYQFPKKLNDSYTHFICVIYRLYGRFINWNISKMNTKEQIVKCKHGFPLFQTCYDCGRIMVKDSPMKNTFTMDEVVLLVLSEKKKWINDLRRWMKGKPVTKDKVREYLNTLQKGE